jgi:hypothetical protein
MLTKDDIERAKIAIIHKSEVLEAINGLQYGRSAPGNISYNEAKVVRVILRTFFQSLSIDEDKAVEEMARAYCTENGWSPDGKIFEEPCPPNWVTYETGMKAALHASPYYKLVKMMGGV